MLCLRITQKKTIKVAFHAGCASKTFYSFYNLTGFIFSMSNNTHHFITSHSHPHHCPFVFTIKANLLLSHNSHSYESKNLKISVLLRGNISSSFSNHNHWSFDSSSPWGIPFFYWWFDYARQSKELFLRYPTEIFAFHSTRIK